MTSITSPLGHQWSYAWVISADQVTLQLPLYACSEYQASSKPGTSGKYAAVVATLPGHGNDKRSQSFRNLCADTDMASAFTVNLN